MPKCGWICGDGVYQRIRQAVDGAGRPLLSIQDDTETLLGKPLYVSPSAQSSRRCHSLGFGALIFGDLDHFHIRVSRPTLQRTTQQIGTDVTKGEALYIARIRMDSALFDPSAGSAPPLVWAEVHELSRAPRPPAKREGGAWCAFARGSEPSLPRTNYKPGARSPAPETFPSSRSDACFFCSQRFSSSAPVVQLAAETRKPRPR